MSDERVVALQPSGNLLFYCPGCNDMHVVDAARWDWNGSAVKPTLSPSVLHFTQLTVGGARQTICHYYITDGRISYCGDCPHELANKTVDMVPYDRAAEQTE